MLFVVSAGGCASRGGGAGAYGGVQSEQVRGLQPRVQAHRGIRHAYRLGHGGTRCDIDKWPRGGAPAFVVFLFSMGARPAAVGGEGEGRQATQTGRRESQRPFSPSEGSRALATASATVPTNPRHRQAANPFPPVPAIPLCCCCSPARRVAEPSWPGRAGPWSCGAAHRQGPRGQGHVHGPRRRRLLGGAPFVYSRSPRGGVPPPSSSCATFSRGRGGAEEENARVAHASPLRLGLRSTASASGRWKASRPCGTW